MPQDHPYNAGLELLKADVATATEKIAWIGGVAIASLKDNAQYKRALDQLGLGGSVDVITDITNLQVALRATTARRRDGAHTPAAIPATPSDRPI